MIKNYIKIAWRNLLKNPQQTTINLLGLTIGTGSCLFILIYVFAQLGYDAHHEQADNIYRVETIIEREGANFDTAAASPPIAFAIKEDFPEVTEATRVVLTDVFFSTLIRASNSNDGYYEPRAYIADSTFFKVFDYRFVEGSPTGALNEPNTVVLSSKLAHKLFGEQQVLDKEVVWGSGEDELVLTIKGVFDETYGKSHLNPNYIVSMGTEGMGTFVQGFESFATNNFVYSYIQLSPNSSAIGLQQKLPEFIEVRGGEDLADAGMLSKTHLLKNIADIHLYSEGRKNQLHEVSSIKFLYFLLSLAFFIQLVACVNFINLSTARASKRAKEIGIRKVVGAGKRMLRGQFLGESILLSMTAVLISVPLTLVLLPYLNELTNASLNYTNVLQWKITLLLLIIGLLTGLIAGIYPAILLSAIHPVKAFKRTNILGSGNGTLRKALVVFQFVVSISLVVAVIIITQQFRFSQNKDLGYDKENMLALRIGTDEASSKFDAIKELFLKIPGVTAVSSGNYAPSENVLSDNGLYLPGGSRERSTIVKRNGVSEDYFKTMRIPFLAGRDFTARDTVDQIIVNRATLETFDIPLEKALSAQLIQSFGEETFEMRIIGVVENYHYASIKEAISPLFLYKENSPNWLFLKTKTKNYGQLLAALETEWKKSVQNVPFDYRFVDREIAQLYAEEKRLGKISIVFTLLAIVISCLGLFGLVSYVAEQKKKEIGIRKVLGASVNSVVRLLTKDFIKLVVIALFIAVPIAYLLMDRWLQDYTYRIDIKWWVFALAGGCAMFITLLTVGFQSLKSAVANPIKSLKTE